MTNSSARRASAPTQNRRRWPTAVMPGSSSFACILLLMLSLSFKDNKNRHSNILPGAHAFSLLNLEENDDDTLELLNDMDDFLRYHGKNNASTVHHNSTSSNHSANATNPSHTWRPLNILMIHQNFPSQFRFLAPALARRGHTVKAFVVDTTHPQPGNNNQQQQQQQNQNNQQFPRQWHGVDILPYRPSRGSTADLHEYLVSLETKVIRGQALYNAAVLLKNGTYHYDFYRQQDQHAASNQNDQRQPQNQQPPFTPDVIFAHPGWGESLFVHQVWPDAKIALYCEFYYAAQGQDVGFDPEFSDDNDSNNNVCQECRIRLNNAYNHIQEFDAALSPTHWQKSTYPQHPFQEKMTVIFDGVHTQRLQPNPQATLTIGRIANTKENQPATIPQTITLQRILGHIDNTTTTTRDSDAWEVVTYVTRTLEPLRGIHIMMRALPRILRERPRARILIVGRETGGYSGNPKYEGTTWKDIFQREISPLLSSPDDWQRVHFVGLLENQKAFYDILQVSMVHVYLTAPFVLSWSLVESMSLGCAIVASDTPPVHEVIAHNESGRLVDFFDPNAVAEQVIDLLHHPEERARLGANARRRAVEQYDLQNVCLPKQIGWLERVAEL